MIKYKNYLKILKMPSLNTSELSKESMQNAKETVMNSLPPNYKIVS